MAVMLQVGEKKSMERLAPNSQIINAGHRWDSRDDLDICVAMLGSNNEVNKPEDFIYYANKRGRNDSVILDKDCRDGMDDSQGSSIPGVPDENVRIDFAKVPDDIEAVVLASWIFDGPANYAGVPGAGVDVIDMSAAPDVLPGNTNAEHEKYLKAVALGKKVAEFELTTDFAKGNGAILMRWERDPENRTKWTIEAQKDSVSGGMRGVMDFFGVSVA